MEKKIVSPITLTRLLISMLIMNGLLVQFAVAQTWTIDEYDTNGDGTTDLHVRHRDTDADGKDDEWHFDRDKDGVFEPNEPHKTGVTKVTPYFSELGSQVFKVEHDGKWQLLGFRDYNGDGDTADLLEMIEIKSESSVFVSDRDEPGNWDIYLMDLNDLSVSRLTNNSAIDNHPAISPDGRWIVWSSTRGNGVDFDIYIAKLGDLAHVEGTAKRLTFDSYPNGPQTHYPDRHPHWSPDGTMIVFDSKNRPLDHPIEIKSECSVPKIITPPKFFENLNIIKIDALGNVVAYVELDIRDAWDDVNDPNIWRNDTATYVGHPGFSPDGTKILFTAAIDVEGTVWEVYTVDIELVSMTLVGGSLQRITNGSLYPPNPNPVQMSGGAHYTSDGSKILFSSTRTPLGNSQLFWAYAGDIDAPVKASRRLTSHLGNDYVPEPLPDGQVVFVSDRGLPSMCYPGVEGPTMDLDLFIMDANGSGQTNLTDNDSADEMLLIADEVSWFCGLKPNLSSCTYQPRIFNLEALWLMRYADVMIPPDLLQRFNISDARPLYTTYWNNLNQYVSAHPHLQSTWAEIYIQTEWLMTTFPGFEDETALRNWMGEHAACRDQLYVLPSIMHEDGIGKPLPPIPADFVRDGVIDYKDLDVLTDNWLLAPPTDPLAPPTDPIVDLYPDGKIDFKDFAEFGKYWLDKYWLEKQL